MQQNSHIAVVGGGIAGLTTAIALRRLGFQPVVFESAPEIKALGAGLALAANAIQGLQYLGLADKVIPLGEQLSHFAILDERGKVISETDSTALSRKYGLNNFAIHRGALHQVLLEALGDTPLHTGKKAIRADETKNGVCLTFADGSAYQADYVIAADGVHSPLRQQLVPNSGTRYAGYTCWRAVVKNPGIAFSGATETWGTKGRIGLVPLANDQIYWFLCQNAPPQDPAMKAIRIEDLRERFQHYHAPVAQVLEATQPEQLLWNDIVDVPPLERYAFGRILLMGDAAHATTPNMGQGACQAIEGAAVLLQEWQKTLNADTQTVFQRFEQRRLPRAKAVVERSWNIGKVAQITSPFWATFRNAAMRLVPASVNEKQLAFLYQTKLD